MPDKHTIKPSNFHHIPSNIAEKLSQQSAFVEILPKPCFLVLIDTDFTIVYANPAFYQLIGYTKEEVHYRYGNRLSALTADLPQITSIPNHPNSLQFKQKFRGNGQELWVETQACMLEVAQTRILFCISTDIAEYLKLQTSLQTVLDINQWASSMSCNEVFQYDRRTQKAHIFLSHMTLNQITDQDQEEHQGFPNAIIAKGLIDPSYQTVFLEAFHQIQRGISSSCELKMATSDKQPLWMRLVLDLSEATQEEPFSVVGILLNITAQKELSLQYISETQYFQALLSEKAAYAQVDISMNQITRIGGMWNLYNELIHTVTYAQLIEQFINKVVHPEDRKHYLELMQPDNFIHSLDNGIDRLSCQFRRIVEQNKMMWMELHVNLFRDPFSRHVMALVYLENIDEKKHLELELLHNSQRDYLTNTLNKKSAETAIRKILSTSNADESFCFMIVSLNHFQEINDTYGHKAGDNLLVKLSHILSEQFSKDDILGRFGDQVFVLFLRDSLPKHHLEEQMKQLQNCILAEKNPLLSCSIGITHVPGQSSFEEVFYQAKESLHHSINDDNCFYTFYEDIVPSLHDSFHFAGNVHPYSNLPLSLPAELKDNISEDFVNFDAFISAQGDMAYLVDIETFEFIIGNQAFYDRIGMTKAQCIGMKCYEIMHNRTTPCPFCSKANWSKDKFYLWRNMNETLEQEFLMKNKIVEWEGRDVLLTLSVDISNNKSILDSMENGATESHNILSGVQRMMEESGLKGVMNSALESIGCFFRADAAQFWMRNDKKTGYRCIYQWLKSPDTFNAVSKEDATPVVSTWLHSRKWSQPVVIENLESMLCDSYEMYQLMKQSGIYNQRWFPLKDGESVLGIVAIGNITSNLQNISFLNTFGCFIISEWKKRALMEKILYVNGHDELTNLLSRNSYECYLQEYNNDSCDSVGILLSDINDLKGINSRKGFQTGDNYIKMVSGLLQAIFVNDAIFRLNGNEFLVISKNISWADLQNKTKRLMDEVEEDNFFSISCGYAWDNVEKDLNHLIDQATQAMKLNKKQYYNDKRMEKNDGGRHEMLQNLLKSIEQREFVVFLQPKIDIKSGKLIGAEALIRYYHKEKGIVPPGKFIDIVEKNNMIRYIDLFVFEEVCRILERWLEQGINLPIVSLNFSRLTLLERDILSSVETIFSKYHIPRNKVEIEITESIIGIGKTILYQTANELYQSGFSISLDDFGTKYTNLSILSELDFDVLKLDKSLINALAKQKGNQIILKNVITMCNDLNINVIAEGVETEEQQKILKALGCQYGQGYLYGKPMPISEFEKCYFHTIKA